MHTKFSETPNHSENVFFFFDLQNIGVDTLVVSLSALLTELYLNIHFSVMAAQICIKKRGFYKLDTLIRSIFPRVHENPIFRLDYFHCYSGDYPTRG